MTQATPGASSPPADAKPRFFYGYVIVAASFLTLALIYGVRFSFGVFLKPMSAEFGWNRAMIAGAFSLSWIVEGSLTMFIGHLNDRFGPRLVITTLGFLAGASYLLMSRVTDLWQLYLFCGLVGGASNIVFIPLTSTIARWFTRRRSMMTGFAISGIGIGAMVGPILAADLISNLDWRAAYIVLGGAILAVVIIAAQFLRRDPTQVGQTPFGEAPTKQQQGRPDALGFTLREALRSRQFWLFFGMMFCLAFAFFSLQVHTFPYVSDRELSPAIAAGILAVIGGASIAGRGVLGMIGDKIGNSRAFVLGFVLITVSLVCLLTLTDTWALYLFAALLGLGYGNSSTQQAPLAAALFGLKSHGLIFSAAGIGFTLGAALGPFLSGYIFDATHAYRLAFLVCLGVAVLGLALNAVLPPLKRR